MRRHTKNLFCNKKARNRQQPGTTLWSELMRSEKLNFWRMAKLKVSYCEARQEDDKRKSNVQKAMANHCASPKARIGHTVVRGPCHRFPLADYIWWVSLEHRDSAKSRMKQCNWWCTACGGQYNWRESFLTKQDGVDPSEAKVFRAYAPPQSACENLVCARITAGQSTKTKTRTTWSTRSLKERENHTNPKTHKLVRHTSF